MLHQPCGGNFFTRFQRRIAGYFQSASCGPLLESLVLRCREDGIFEKRACTAAIFIPRNDQHSLEGADVPHGFPNFRHIRRRFPSIEVALEIPIADLWLPAGDKRISHAQNDEPATLAGVEDTAAISEAAGLTAEFAHLIVPEIECLDRLHCLGHLLPVGPHILHWSAANAARNAAQTLHSGTVLHHGVRHKFVPRLAPSYIKNSLAIVAAALLDARNR